MAPVERIQRDYGRDDHPRAVSLLAALAASVLGRRMAATFMRDAAGEFDRTALDRQKTWTDGALALTTLRQRRWM